MNLNNNIGRVQGTLDGLQRRIVTQKLDENIRSGRFQSVAGILSEAKATGVSLEPTAVSDLADRVIRVGTDEAWDAATELVSYKSSLTPPQSLPQGVPIGAEATYHLPMVPGETEIRKVFAVWGASTSDASPILEVIGENLNRGAKISPRLIYIKGSVARLDGIHARNVIFQEMEIVYNGGPIRLEGAKFVNCRFKIERNVPGQALLSAIASPSDRVNIRLPQA